MSPISVVIPAYNEEHVICRVLDRLVALKAQGGCQEIIVVNDASTDQTRDKVRLYADVKLIDNRSNAGYGRSIKNGLAEAQCDLVAIIDADNTYPVEDIPRLAGHMESNDMVVGKREQIVYARCNWIKQRGRDAIDMLCSYLAGRWIPDINSGLRIFKKNMAVSFIDELCDRFSFTTSLTLLTFFARRRVHYISITYNTEPSQRQTKVRIWKDGYRTLLLILSLGVRYRPVRTIVLFVVPVLLAVWMLL